MIGEEIIGFLQQFGITGFIFAIYIIFIVDSVIFPSLPELFFLIAFLINPVLKWGFFLLMLALFGIFCGNTLLYIFAKKTKIPSFIKEIMKKYSRMLIFGDERILFMNNMIPVLPYTGAFIAVNKWNYKKSIFYIESGAIIKLSILLLLSNSFYILFAKGIAERATIALVLITISISFILSYMKKRKMEIKGEER